MKFSIITTIIELSVFGGHTRKEECSIPTCKRDCIYISHNNVPRPNNTYLSNNITSLA